MTKQIKLDSITPEKVNVYFQRDWLGNKCMKVYIGPSVHVSHDNLDIVRAILNYYLEHKDDTIGRNKYQSEFSKDGVPIPIRNATFAITEWVENHYQYMCDQIRPVYCIRGNDQIITIGHKHRGSCTLVIYNLKD